VKFANPRNDIAFKKVFGDEKKKGILISFLNAVLDLKRNRKIVEVKILNPYQAPKIEDLKETILDIQAKDKSGQKFIVEMQNRDYQDFPNRSLYYTAKAYVEQLDKNENYINLKKVYFIGICNFKMFNNKNYISRHLILNQETMQNDLKNFEFAFIELPKFKKKLNQLETIIEKWTYFIKRAEKLDYIPNNLKEIKEIDEAYDVLIQHKWNKKELEVYDYIRKKEMDDRAVLATAINKGRMQGLQEGLKEGLKKGKLERDIEIAKNLLDVLDIKTIALKTGLTIEEIELLEK